MGRSSIEWTIRVPNPTKGYRSFLVGGPDDEMEQVMVNLPPCTTIRILGSARKTDCPGPGDFPDRLDSGPLGPGSLGANEERFA